MLADDWSAGTWGLIYIPIGGSKHIPKADSTNIRAVTQPKICQVQARNS